MLLVICLVSADAPATSAFSLPTVLSPPPSVKDSSPFPQQNISYPKGYRIKAAAIALLLGNFGAHRIYLGTDPIVPVAYCLTLGGFFLLPLIDAVFILTTPHPETIFHNPHFFLWFNKTPVSSFTPP